jgi:hypothetical protein
MPGVCAEPVAQRGGAKPLPRQREAKGSRRARASSGDGVGRQRGAHARAEGPEPKTRRDATPSPQAPSSASGGEAGEEAASDADAAHTGAAGREAGCAGEPRPARRARLLGPWSHTGRVGRGRRRDSPPPAQLRGEAMASARLSGMAPPRPDGPRRPAVDATRTSGGVTGTAGDCLPMSIRLGSCEAT